MPNEDETKTKTFSPASESAEGSTPCLFKRMILFILFLAVGIGGTLAVHTFYPEWLPHTGVSHKTDPALAANYDALSQRLAAAERTLARLDAEAKTLQSSTLTQTPPQDPSIRAELGLLEETIRNVQSAFDTVGQNVQTVQKKFESQAHAFMGYMLMREKALDGKPFEQERLWVVERVKNNPPALALLEELKPHAAGLTPVSVLYSEWKALEPKAKASLSEENAATWQERLMASASSLIRIESLKNVKTGEGASGAIRQALEQEEIYKALELVALLPANARATVQPWVEKVEKRAAAEKIIQALADSLLVYPDNVPTNRTEASDETEEKAMP